MPQCKPLRQVSYSTRPAASMRRPWPKCRPPCKNASCAPSLHGACWRAVTPKTCRATNTAASRSTPVSASKPTTALRWSVCCAICARPPFAMERLRKAGSELIYRCGKQHSEPRRDFYADRRGAKADELHLTPLELIDRIAALVPPPRTHRHRYFGVLAPNSPLRDVVTAMAQAPAQVAAVPADPATTGNCSQSPAQHGHAGATASRTTPRPEPPPPPKRPAHYLWAVLIARIYEVFPLLCPICGGQMRIIAFITHSAEIRHILDHIGADSEPPHIASARGPPLWDELDAQSGEGQPSRARLGRGSTTGTGLRVGPAHQLVTPSEAAVSIAAGRSFARASPNAYCLPISRHGAASERSTCLGRTCFEAQNSCHTWPHAVEFPIRSCHTWPHAVEFPIRSCHTWPHAVEFPIRIRCDCRFCNWGEY
jgi:hypothetical protein